MLFSEARFIIISSISYIINNIFYYYSYYFQNGKIELTKETYSKLWHEFFLSNDPAAKGNFLFGTIA